MFVHVKWKSFYYPWSNLMTPISRGSVEPFPIFCVPFFIFPTFFLFWLLTSSQPIFSVVNGIRNQFHKNTRHRSISKRSFILFWCLLASCPHAFGGSSCPFDTSQILTLLVAPTKRSARCNLLAFDSGQAAEAWWLLTLTARTDTTNFAFYQHSAFCTFPVILQIIPSFPYTAFTDWCL